MTDSKIAFDFIENELKIQNIDAKFKEDKLNLLNIIIRKCYRVIPFNNILLLSKSSEQRSVVTREVVIKNCLEKKGGGCYILNTFMNFLLTSVGFNATLLECNLILYPTNQHLVNLVTNVKHPNDIYLVDAGAWYPFFTAIELTNQNLDSKIECNSFCKIRSTSKYDVVTILHRKGEISELVAPIDNLDDWNGYYSLSLTDLGNGCKKLRSAGERYHGNSAPFFKIPMFSIYPLNFAVVIFGNKLRIYDEIKSELKTSIIKNENQAVEVITKYAPLISKKMVEFVFTNYFSNLYD